LSGAVLGLRLKVFVPVICGALALVVVDGIARGDALWRLAFSMIMVATALQLEYILGNVIRFVMAPGQSFIADLGPNFWARLTNNRAARCAR
jgi:hypothetical protein